MPTGNKLNIVKRWEMDDAIRPDGLIKYIVTIAGSQQQFASTISLIMDILPLMIELAWDNNGNSLNYLNNDSK